MACVIFHRITSRGREVAYLPLCEFADSQHSALLEIRYSVKSTGRSAQFRPRKRAKHTIYGLWSTGNTQTALKELQVYTEIRGTF